MWIGCKASCHHLSQPPRRARRLHAYHHIQGDQFDTVNAVDGEMSTALTRVAWAPMIENMTKNLAIQPAPRLGGADATKAAIVEAARRLFSIAGYRSTSVRAIAKEARIDPALIIRYFGSKEDLFLEALAIGDFSEIALAGPLEGMGSRIVLEMISGDIQNKLSAYVSLMQASDSEAIRCRLRDVVRTGFVTRLAQRLTGKDTELRAYLISAQIGGLINSLAVIQHEALLAAPIESIARHYGAAIQLLIDDDSSDRTPRNLRKSSSGKK